jgi:NAD(P)-dependent dehydrogenase (short-subunit alcohol dehydrogenase family)
MSGEIGSPATTAAGETWRKTMAKWTVANLPDMTGKSVLVTGASSGIGLIAARELARVGARVVLVVRNVPKGQDAASRMPGDVEVRRLDVSDLASVRAFAESWSGKIDVLVNNAGVMDVPLQRTRDGLDLQTATNSLGPFLLTNHLLPHVTDRVVWVTSQLHRRGHLRIDDLGWDTRPYKPMDAYNDSKLQVVLFSLELQRRLTAAGSPVRSILAHPGIATTALAAHSSSNAINRFPFLLNDAEHGALPTLFAATQDVPGNAYVGPDGFGSIKGHPTVRRAGKGGLDAAAASKLWAAASTRTGVAA